MSQMPNQPMTPGPQPRRTPRQVASMFADYVFSFIIITFWFLLGTAVLAAGVVGVWAIVWGAQVVLHAVGGIQ